MMVPAAHPIAAIMREASSGTVAGGANEQAAGVIRWISELGAVLIPSFGFFIHSRDFFRTLVGEGSAARSGECGSLVALGFPEDKAKRVGNQLRDGVLLYLSCPEAAETSWALELLRDTGAQEAGLLKDDAVSVGAA
jgi:hypothetical protein